MNKTIDESKIALSTSIITGEHDSLRIIYRNNNDDKSRMTIELRSVKLRKDGTKFGRDRFSYDVVERIAYDAPLLLNTRAIGHSMNIQRLCLKKAHDEAKEIISAYIQKDLGGVIV